MRIGKGLVVLLVVMFSATSAMAAGFRLPIAGAKAMGMGFAFTAQANDPSAIYFNPAGIMQLEGSNATAGLTYIRENGGTFTGTTPLQTTSLSEEQKDLNFVVPNTFYTRKISPNFAFGVGVFSPFGLGQEYKDRNNSVFRNQITKIELMTAVINPTVAFKVNEHLSFGFGLDYMYGKAKLAKTGVINNAAPGGNTPLNIFLLDLEGDGDAWGYNFGILATPSPNWKVGFSYRSPFTLDIKDGDVDLTSISSTTITALGVSAQTIFGGATFTTKGRTTITMPATAAFGVAYVKDRLTVEADLDWTFWNSYNSLNIDLRNNTALLPDSNSTKDWKDVMAVRIGAEYRITVPLTLRLGFVYDPTPVPSYTMDPSLPDADRRTYHVGTGYKYGQWTVDAAYYYVDKKDRTVSNQTTPAYPSYGTGFSGKWTGDAHLVALNLGYKF